MRNMSIPENDDTEGNTDEYKIEYLPEDYPFYDLNFSLLFVGDSYIGKYFLVKRAVHNRYTEVSTAFGLEFFIFLLKVNDKIIKFNIFVSTGSEIYRSLIENFYPKSSLIVLTYGINNWKSFNILDYFLNEIKFKANSDVRIFLVGTKADLIEERKVSIEEGLEYKKRQNLDLFMETSAKTGYNARNILVEAAIILYKDDLKSKGKATYIKKNEKRLYILKKYLNL